MVWQLACTAGPPGGLLDVAALLVDVDAAVLPAASALPGAGLAMKEQKKAQEIGARSNTAAPPSHAAVLPVLCQVQRLECQGRGRRTLPWSTVKRSRTTITCPTTLPKGADEANCVTTASAITTAMARSVDPEPQSQS